MERVASNDFFYLNHTDNICFFQLTTDMIGMDKPKIDGSVEPKSWLVHHEGESRDNASSHTPFQPSEKPTGGFGFESTFI